MKRFFKYIAIILLVFIGLSTLISVLSLQVLKRSNFYKPSYLVNAVPEDNLDYIILGSSVGLTTLNSKLIDSETGLKGVNLSEDDTGLSSQYLMLQHALYEGKKIKYCILAPGLPALRNKKASFGDNDYRFLMFTHRDYVSSYYKNAAPKYPAARVSYLTKWVPFIGVSYYNTELFYPSLNVVFDSKKRNRFDDKGNYTYPKNQNKIKHRPFETANISFDHPYLSRIVDLCKENGISLIYYLAPEMNKAVNYTVDGRFTIINHTELLKDSSDFYDNLHVNHEGREKASHAFAEQFSTIYKNQ